MELFNFDKNFKHNLVCGVDEAGRGPLAGPVVACAVILKDDAANIIPDVNDSKKFSEKKRKELYERVIDAAKEYKTFVVSSRKIDEINILNATMIAMKEAVLGLKLKPDIVLIDGNKAPDLNFNIRCFVKGDQKSASIAAASIIAKVERDKIMEELDLKYDKYFFKKNKGYGTKQHYESIIKYGITPEHRKTFLKNLKEKKLKIQNISGKLGEKICYSWLINHGFSVFCKNYKSPYGEIDLIATKDDLIYFVEVKLRQKNSFVSPCEAVDLKKRKKIIKTAVSFNLNHPNSFQPKFVVMEVLRNKEEFFVNFIDDAFVLNDEYDLFKDC